MKFTIAINFIDSESLFFVKIFLHSNYIAIFLFVDGCPEQMEFSVEFMSLLNLENHSKVVFCPLSALGKLHATFLQFP